jgi:Zn-dependent M28 family amino/carboxypeptidase
VRTRNVVAQTTTTTGSTHDVVTVGAHLDSVPAGPGINDDGSGGAAVLGTALQMSSSPPIRNAVRFGFWAAEEVGLLGSANYVRSLDDDQLKDIALYLNFDMLGSPNPAYYTMDGDQSAPPHPSARRRGCPRAPPASNEPWWPTSPVQARPRRTPPSKGVRITNHSPAPGSRPAGSSPAPRAC